MVYAERPCLAAGFKALCHRPVSLGSCSFAIPSAPQVAAPLRPSATEGAATIKSFAPWVLRPSRSQKTKRRLEQEMPGDDSRAPPRVGTQNRRLEHNENRSYVCFQLRFSFLSSSVWARRRTPLALASLALNADLRAAVS